MMAGVLRALERLLLPNACVACERLVEPQRPDALVCGPCLSRLRYLGPGCERCRQPMPPVGPCRFCDTWPQSLESVLSAVWLGAEAREMIHHLKYEGYTALAGAIADVIRRAVPHPPTGVLVPVPLGAQRRRARGYNQATAIARALSARWRLPVWEHVLDRSRDTCSQTRLGPEERRTNVSGAFVAAPPPHAQGKGERGGGTRTASAGKRETGNGKRRGPAVILVDDVLTTGATLAAAASALEGARWPTVSAVTFARALPFARRAMEGDGSVEALVAVGAT